MPTKITEDVRKRTLRRPLTPSTTRDKEIPGFTLVVTRRRAFWCLTYQLRGINPRTGRRHGGGTRYELGDAFAMPLSDARTAALKAKARVRDGHDPQHEKMAQRSNLAALRTIVPTTVGEALDAFSKTLMAKTETKPSLRTRTETIRYARKGARLMKAESIAIGAVTKLMIRLMLDEFVGSQDDKRLTFSGLNQFFTWCRRREMIEHNPLDDLDHGERPKPGAARKHVPAIETLRAIWSAAETEPAHVRDMIRFALLTPLRRDEFAELKWSEVDLAKGTIAIPGPRMKNRETHTLPLSRSAIAILEARPQHGPFVFPTLKGKPYSSWTNLHDRIRNHISEENKPPEQRFRIHDIRRSFASHMSEAGHDIDALDQTLAHKRPGMSGVYNLAARMQARHAALESWAKLIAGEGVAAGNVLLFSPRST